MNIARHTIRTAVLIVALATIASAADRPNILVIWGDDIGWSNLGAYEHGVMAYPTPNLDSIAHEGVMFTDHYAQPSCTAGRAAFITGQYPIRSGMTTVGQPGDALGLKTESPCLAEYLKEASNRLPDIAQWSEASHEVQLTESIAQLSRPRAEKSAESRSTMILAGLQSLTALSHRRPDGDNPYGELVFDEGYFNYYPINLKSFDYHLVKTWSSLSVQEMLRWLLLNWGIEVHLRVALRKLRGQSQSTFRIRPSDRGMEVIAAPPAVHTRPRFNQAVRVLKDIGALELAESGRWRPSAFGKAMVELGDAP